MASDFSHPDRATAVHHDARLRVRADGPAEVGGSGSYHWRIVDRDPVVAFLATSLLGLGSGESLAVRTQLDAGAALVLTGQGPTSLLRTSAACRYSFAADLAAGSSLTYLPWATVPFRGSRAEMETDIVLAPDATFVGWDIVSAGRVHFGEEFTLEALRSTWRVHRDGPLINERFELRGSERAFAQVALGRSTYLGTMYAVGPPGDLPSLDVVTSVKKGAAVAVSRPCDEVLVIKALGHSAEQVETLLWPVVVEVRAALALEPLDPQAVARRWLGSRRPQKSRRPRPGGSRPNR